MKQDKSSVYKVFLLALIILATTLLTSQNKEEIVIPLSNPNGSGKLIVDNTYGSIHIIGYDGKEVIVKAGAGTSKKKKSINGLKKIGKNSINVEAREVNNVVYVKNRANQSIVDFVIKVPKNFSLKLETLYEGEVLIEDVNGEFEVINKYGKIHMLNVSGSVIANTLYGNINVNFAKVTENANMAFSSLDGDIDVTFPKDFKANIKAKSNGGNIYSDFDIELKNNKSLVGKTKSSRFYKLTVEKWTLGLINGGGPEMTFTISISGDIFIRSTN